MKTLIIFVTLLGLSLGAQMKDVIEAILKKEASHELSEKDKEGASKLLEYGCVKFTEIFAQKFPDDVPQDWTSQGSTCRERLDAHCKTFWDNLKETFDQSKLKSIAIQAIVCREVYEDYLDHLEAGNVIPADQDDEDDTDDGDNNRDDEDKRSLLKELLKRIMSTK